MKEDNQIYYEKSYIIKKYFISEIHSLSLRYFQQSGYH